LGVGPTIGESVMGKLKSQVTLPIKDPILDVVIRRGRFVASLVPARLDLLHQDIFVLLSTLLDLVACAGEVILQLSKVPFGIRRFDGRLPVSLDEIL